MLTLTSSTLARVTAKWSGFCPNAALLSTLPLLSRRVSTASAALNQHAKCNGERNLFSIVAVTLGSILESRRQIIRPSLPSFSHGFPGAIRRRLVSKSNK